MTIGDVMTRDVITVGPSASIHEAAMLMAEHGVSGLPVIDDDGRLVGILSEGDLILRQRRPPAAQPWWRRFFEDGEQLAREYRKATGITVGAVMTTEVTSINPVWGLDMAATIFQNRQIRRLPVVADGQLVGIVTRADLIKALVVSIGAGRGAAQGAPRPSETGGPMNWDGLERHRVDLKLPLLVIRGSRGVLACGYVNVETFNRTGEAGAIVTGVKDFDDMLAAKVVGVSTAAAQAGITTGMTGAEVVERIR